MNALIITRAFYRKGNGLIYARALPHRLLTARIPEKSRPRTKNGRRTRPKVGRRAFIRFMVLALILSGYHPTTRELAALSRRPALQQGARLEPFSHSWVSMMLRALPSEALQRLVLDLVRIHKDLAYRRTRKRQAFKIIDVTTWPVGMIKYASVTKINQHARGVRLALRIDHETDTPELIINASKNSSDNTVFTPLTSGLKGRSVTFVFDRGFNRLADLRRIVGEGNHFVTRWDQSQGLVVIWDRTDQFTGILPSGQELLRDEWVVVGSPRHQEQSLTWRRIIVHHRPSGSTWTLLTDQLTVPVADIVTAYELRWRIEVHFRWIKSTLQVHHVPATTWEGITNFLLLVMLAYLVVRITALLLREAADSHGVSPTWARRCFAILHDTVMTHHCFVRWQSSCRCLPRLINDGCLLPPP